MAVGGFSDFKVTWTGGGVKVGSTVQASIGMDGRTDGVLVQRLVYQPPLFSVCNTVFSSFCRKLDHKPVPMK